MFIHSGESETSCNSIRPLTQRHWHRVAFGILSSLAYPAPRSDGLVDKVRESIEES